MRAPVQRLKKKEIIWLSVHRCKHAHPFLVHYSCYLKENPIRERLGFLDIETSNLDANYGIMLSYCIKDAGTGRILERTISKKEVLSKDIDSKLVKSCISDMNSFDRVVTFYGAKFDLPFIRTRALSHGLKFPHYGSKFHVDVWMIAKLKLRLNRNSQDNVARAVLGKSSKTRIDYIHWLRASQGNPRSLKFILNHNRGDVNDLMKIYFKLIDFKRATDTSI